MTRRTLPICAALILACCAVAAAQARTDIPALAWKLHRPVQDVRGVFCHRTDPHVAWAATGTGLFATTDAGKTWQALPAAAAQEIGLVTVVAPSPAEGGILVVGTDDNGVHVSTDAGKSFQRADSEAQPIASPHVEAIDFCPADPSWRTVLVTHGKAAPGLSVSRDLGQTWGILATDRYLGKLAKNGETIIAAGSLAPTEGRIWAIHRSGTDGFRWEHSNPGIRPTEPVATPGRWRFFMATLDGNILQTYNDGRTWSHLAEFSSAGWVSLFWARGPTAASRILAAYDPRKNGLLLSTRSLANAAGTPSNNGLYVGPFVKSGGMATVNANGTIYYIVLNNGLWVGRRVAPKAGPTVVQTWADPPTVWVGRAKLAGADLDMHSRIARVAAGEITSGNVRAIASASREIRGYIAGMGFNVLARIAHPKGLGAIKAVTVDAAAIGGKSRTPLLDDGHHRDGKAADGVFGGEVTFDDSPFGTDNPTARRAGFPGIGALTVTATDTAGKSDSWCVVAAINRHPEPVYFSGVGRWAHAQSEGSVTIGHARDHGVQPRTHAIMFSAAGPGPWRGTTISTDHGENVSGLDNLRLYIKGNTNQELYLQLVDRFKIGIDLFDQPHYGHPVGLIAGGYLKSITPAYQKVSVPVKALLPPGKLFLRLHGAGIALSVRDDGKPGTYYVDQVRLEP